MQRGLYLSLSCALALSALTDAFAQTAVERNLPPAPVAPAAPIVPPNAIPASQDSTSLGVNLRAVVLLGAQDAPLANASVGNGVQLGKVAMLDNKKTRAVLARFIGQPLSRKLIAEIESEIAGQARKVDRPFVSMSTPEQEITGGVLQIRVTEFVAGAIGTSGAAGNEGAALARDVRLKSGQPINSSVLSEDLDWLNRNPFRTIGALFAPASTEGATDLTLSVEQRNPYRFYAGWANTGSQSTGFARSYIGAVSALPGLQDSYFSYQLTGSRDFWKEGDSYLRSPARFKSQGMRVYIPTFARQDIELTFSDSLTNQTVNADFTVRQRTTEATLGYRMALSGAGLPAGSGDILFAIEGKRQHRVVYFGAQTALDLSADAWQGLLGWSKGWQGDGSQATAAVNLHTSPGGISDSSSGSRLAELTNGRVNSDKYSYVTVDLSSSTRLPRGFAVTSQVSGQYASKVLPLSAQIGLGGDGLVRGYTPDDGSFDAGVVLRNELRVPTLSVLKQDGALRDQLAPYLFLDAGRGRDLQLKTSTALASAGIGADYSLGQHVNAGFNSAWALRDGPRTERGDWRIQARATITF